MPVRDFTEESRRLDVSSWRLTDRALVDRGGSSTSGGVDADTGFDDRRESADSARGGRSLTVERVEAALEGSGRDPTGRAGRLFRRFDR